MAEHLNVFGNLFVQAAGEPVRLVFPGNHNYIIVLCHGNWLSDTGVQVMRAGSLQVVFSQTYKLTNFTYNLLRVLHV